MRHLLTAGLASAALGVLACGDDTAGEPGNRYPDQAREEFLAGCEDSGGATSVCMCILDRVQERLSYDEFERISEGVGRDDEPPREVAAAADECAR
jgi:hypothetical protein